jgi:Xaa-Pro aminopeptidase
MRYENIDQSLFIKNRKKYLSQMPEGSVSVFASNDILPSNADGSFGFIQNSTFFYLTGIDQEDCFLILVRGGGEYLFVKETSELIKVWDGEKLSKEQAQKLSGIKEVHWLEDFWKVLDVHLSNREEVFVYRDTTQAARFPSFRLKGGLLAHHLQEKYPLVEIRNPEKVLDQIRLIKESEEINAMKVAIETTHKGLLRAAKFLRPGKFEFEVEAEITHEFLINRSRFHAFSPIIASGANACVLHYVDNNNRIENGDLVLIDFGAEYGNYKADMTRTLPANGKFTDRQAEVYASVLHVLKETRKLMVTGNTVMNLKKETQDLIAKEIVKLGLVTEADLKRSPELVMKYFPHGVSHSLGIDVHDVGNRNTLLASGMVLTCEPGIYIMEESLGIRLENDILITESGNIDLMAHVPLELEEIEKMMKC